MHDTNRQPLVTTARLLRPILNELVFVGGSVAGLLITDKGAPDVRATGDVDTIAEITSYAEYVRFSERLRSLGFSEDASAGAPLCRWRQGPAVLDVMPLEPGILGFSNRWYRDAMNTAIIFALEPELEARVISAPLFLATKLEAFKGRGRGDYIASHDLEDVIAVIDGRIELMDEVSSAVKSVRAYLSAELRGLLKQRRFLDALPAHLPPDSASQSRLPLLLKRIRRLAE